MDREPKTPVEHAKEAVRKAEEEFARNPNDATEAKLVGMRNWLRSAEERAAKDPGFNVRPPKS